MSDSPIYLFLVAEDIDDPCFRMAPGSKEVNQYPFIVVRDSKRAEVYGGEASMGPCDLRRLADIAAAAADHQESLADALNHTLKNNEPETTEREGE